ncbi:MAG: hypothetical protein JJLCMIEE_03033 [Acidimicrobiales bacterium]|nr:hypothetical protein [Acidimicrobiales bacterium]
MKLSATARLMALLALVCVLLVGSMVIALYLHQRNRAHQSVREEALATAETVDPGVAAGLVELEEDGDTGSLERVATELLAEPSVSYVYILDGSGSVLVDVNPTALGSARYADPTGAVEAGTATVASGGDAAPVVRDGEGVLEMAQPIVVTGEGTSSAAIGGDDSSDEGGDAVDHRPEHIGTMVVGFSLEPVAEAGRSTLLYGLLVGSVTTLILLAASFLVVRRETRRLELAAARTEAIAAQRLPALAAQIRGGTEADAGLEELTPLASEGAAELRRLAEALNALDRATADLAGAQAELLGSGFGELFVQLARRNQSLLERQIEYIDELERDETDPDVLANLFHLDHLATRMRRNAESLLVLSGVTPTRINSAPVPVTDVIRAAVAEVEHYPRVRMGHADECRMSGPVAADLAHMLAELLDNALRYSPPGTPVDMVGRRTQDGCYQIEMTDQGIGLVGGKLEELNHLLANPPDSGLLRSRSLGLTVVAKLAARHGIEVHLQSPGESGVTARVSVPEPSVLDGPLLRESSPETNEVDVASPTPGATVAGESLPRRPAAPYPSTGMQRPREPLLDLPRRRSYEPAVGLSGHPPGRYRDGSPADHRRPLWKRPATDVTIDLTDSAGATQGAGEEPGVPGPSTGTERPPLEGTAGPAHAASIDTDPTGGEEYSFLDARSAQASPETDVQPPPDVSAEGNELIEPLPDAHPDPRTPEEVRRLLNRYRGGINRAGEASAPEGGQTR